MATVIHCPDCGGILCATETTDAGPPCTCFTTSAGKFTAPSSPMTSTPPRPRVDPPLPEVLPSPVPQEDDDTFAAAAARAHRSPPSLTDVGDDTGLSPRENDNSGTQVMESPVTEPKKICWKCGKD